MSRLARITGEMRLDEVVRRHPEALRVLHELGMDVSPGDARTVAEAARAHRLAAEHVVALLEDAARRATS